MWAANILCEQNNFFRALRLINVQRRELEECIVPLLKDRKSLYILRRTKFLKGGRRKYIQIAYFPTVPILAIEVGRDVIEDGGAGGRNKKDYTKAKSAKFGQSKTFDFRVLPQALWTQQAV